MKTLSKIFFLVIFVAVVLVGCSGNTPNIPFLNSPTPTASNTPTPTNTSTPTPTATFTPTPTLTPTPTPIGGGSGKVLFEYERAGFESEFPDLEGKRNIFIADLDGGNLIPITNGLRGYNNTEDISPDKTKILVASFSDSDRRKDSKGTLYVLDINNIDAGPIEIVQGFSQRSYYPAAKWLNDTEFVYVGRGEQGEGIYRADIYGTPPIKINSLGRRPERIVAVDDERVYWTLGEYKDYYVRKGDYTAIWWSSLDGSEQGKLEFEGVQVEFFAYNYAFSPDGKWIAWFPSRPEEECNTLNKIRELSESGKLGEICKFLYLGELSNPDVVEKISLIPPDEAKEMVEHNLVYDNYYIAWDVDSSRIFLIHPEYRSFNDRYPNLPPELFYVEIASENHQLVYLDHNSLKSNAEVDPPGQYQPSYKYIPAKIVGFSSDGRQILVLKAKEKNVSMYIFIDLETMEITRELFTQLNIKGINNIHILP